MYKGEYILLPHNARRGQARSREIWGFTGSRPVFETFKLFAEK